MPAARPAGGEGGVARPLQPRFWPLAGVLLLSWSLLAFQLGQRSLWIDEYVTVEMISGTPADVVAAAAADMHPPLYYLALRAWTQAAGSSDLALRWPSAAAALLAAALAARLARRLAGPQAVLPAAALLGLNPALIEFSRMARYYALVMALGVLTTLLLVRAQRQNTWRQWAGYGGATLALLYTSYAAGLLPAAQALALAGTRRGRWGRWAAALAMVGALLGPWLAAHLSQQLELATNFISADLANSGPGLVLGLAAGVYAFSVGETLFPWQLTAWVGLGASLVLAGLGLGKRGQAARPALLIGGLCLVGVAGVTTFVATGVPFLNVPARALFALPYFALAAAAGWAAVRSARGRWVLSAAVGLAWSASLFSLYTGQQYLNPIYYTPAREAASLVREAARPGDLVISDGDSVFDRYFLPAPPDVRHLFTTRHAALSALLSERPPARVWVVTIGRDRTRGLSAAEPVRETLADGYVHTHTERLLAIDPLYNRIKAALVRRPVYDYRMSIELYERASP